MAAAAVIGTGHALHDDAAGAHRRTWARAASRPAAVWARTASILGLGSPGTVLRAVNRTILDMITSGAWTGRRAAW